MYRLLLILLFVSLSKIAFSQDYPFKVFFGKWKEKIIYINNTDPIPFDYRTIEGQPSDDGKGHYYETILWGKDGQQIFSIINRFLYNDSDKKAYGVSKEVEVGDVLMMEHYFVEKGKKAIVKYYPICNPNLITSLYEIEIISENKYQMHFKLFDANGKVELEIKSELIKME